MTRRAITLVIVVCVAACTKAAINTPASATRQSRTPSSKITDTTSTPGSARTLTPLASGTSLPTYRSNMISTGQWIAIHSMLPDGAILYSSKKIVPYYGNVAAIGMTRNAANYPQVKAWMEWYIRHLNATDVWGLGNSMYDYAVSRGVETPLNTADSTDSYPATFLTLAWEFYRTADPGAQSYVSSILRELDLIGQQLVKTQQDDGLTWAKPNRHIKYLMDNCQVYRGLSDLASLFQAVGDRKRASYYTNRAQRAYQGIMSMWLGDAFAVSKSASGKLPAPNWSTWYPDATSQLFPIVEGVLPPSGSKAQRLYASFNAAWPDWANLSNGGNRFPWVLVGNAAALMGDLQRANTYIINIQNRYVTKGYPWPWYSMEAGRFMWLNAFMAAEHLPLPPRSSLRFHVLVFDGHRRRIPCLEQLFGHVMGAHV
jgi:hypothetical protein